jgi:hypothetical protein
MRTQRSILGWILAGLATALRHKRLVLAFYLVPLLPALLWAWVTASHIHGAMDDRPFAQELLGGNAWGVVQDFVAGPDSHVGVFFGALPALLILSLVLQLALAAGASSVLLGKGGETPFFTGVSRYTGRFFRSLLGFGTTLLVAVILVVISSRIGQRLAENAYDERLLYGSIVVGMALFLGLFMVTDLAYDLSRLAAVEHDGRRTFRGYYRALGAVLRRPWKLVPFYLVVLIVLVVAEWLFGVVRGNFVATGGGTLIAIFLVQQLRYLFRAFWQVSFWGGAVAIYRDLGAPAWCGTSDSLHIQPEEPPADIQESYAMPGEPPSSETPSSEAPLKDTDAIPTIPGRNLQSVSPKAPEVTQPITPVTEEEITEPEVRGEAEEERRE